MVSNFSLVMGIAGATAGQQGVLLKGFTGLLAGAFSMALGEWISVKSSRELYENQMQIEMEELETGCSSHYFWNRSFYRSCRDRIKLANYRVTLLNY